MDTLAKLQDIFNDIQTCDPRRFSENLTEALNLLPTDNSFLRIIDSVLLSDKNSLPPKVAHFIRRILEEQSHSNKMIFNSILSYLSDKLNCKNTKVRRNSLKFISLMICIDKSSLYSTLLERIAERLFDKEPSVRKEALKICIPFQMHSLGDSITIQTTIKDMIRYDQSHEIRKIAFLGLEFNSNTLNCILERCIDSNVQIRKAFWQQYFDKIDLQKLDHCQRIYLMKKGINEREFDAKSIFIQKIRQIELKSFIEYFYCEDEEYENCISDYLKDSSEEYYLDNYTPSYLNFLCCYYKVKEERDGRDSLKLYDLEEFVQIFYFKCKETEELMAKNLESSEQSLKVLKYLLKILGYYDIFTEESKKFVYSIINYLSQQPFFSSIVEDYVSLGIRISDDKAVHFVGNLIKNTKGKPTCLLICEFAMKHLPYGEFYDAILSEIAIFHIDSSYNILFWYLMKNYKSEIEEQYLNYLPNKKVIEGLTDLILSNIITVDKIERCLFIQLSKFNISAVIPTCKLLLAKKISDSDFLKQLLIIFYSTDNEPIQQYLALFLIEYFKISVESLIEIFCPVLELITSNHKVFVNQSIFWISNSQAPNGLQMLFFNVCVFILSNYESLVNKKYLFNTLSKINVSDKWDSILTKKIIFLLSAILRKRPRENVNALLNPILEIDDGIPMSTADFESVKDYVSV